MIEGVKLHGKAVLYAAKRMGEFFDVKKAFTEP